MPETLGSVSRPALGPTQHSIQLVPVLSEGGGVKWPMRDVDHQPLSSAEIKERVELHIYPPALGPSRSVLGVNFTIGQCCTLQLHKR
jgi:hypothetical protein